MDRQRLHIGTYVLQPYARSETHIRELAECGIDLVFAIENDRPALDLLHRYGIGAIVTGVVPGWFGGTGENAGTLRAVHPPQAYLEAISRFCDHPAIRGIDVGDEPSCRDFAYFGEILRLVKTAFPDKLAFLNLYPSYGMLASNSPAQAQKELGTADYADYLRQYCRRTDTDYLCFDHYVYSSDVERFMEDLHTAATACRETDRSLWVVLQVNSHDPSRYLSENQLRFQGFTALAFGAECIAWACYTAGWWHNQVLDAQGNKTEQYAKLKQVNRELRATAEVCMRYRWADTHRITGSASIDATPFRHIHTTSGEPLLVGRFTARSQNGQSGIFLCTCGDPADQSPHDIIVQFRTDMGVTLRYHSPAGIHTLSPDTDGWYRITIPTCSGGFLTTE